MLSTTTQKEWKGTTILYLVARHVDAGVHDFDVGYGTFVKRGVTVRKQLIKELISRARLQNKPKYANFSQLTCSVYHHYVGIFILFELSRAWKNTQNILTLLKTDSLMHFLT